VTGADGDTDGVGEAVGQASGSFHVHGSPYALVITISSPLGAVNRNTRYGCRSLILGPTVTSTTLGSEPPLSLYSVPFRLTVSTVNLLSLNAPLDILTTVLPSHLSVNVMSRQARAWIESTTSCA
jgi:hypothetical protein